MVLTRRALVLGVLLATCQVAQAQNGTYQAETATSGQVQLPSLSPIVGRIVNPSYEVQAQPESPVVGRIVNPSYQLAEPIVGRIGNPSYQPVLLSASSVPPSLEFQDRNPPGWISGGDPVGIPGERGELLDPRFYPPPGWFSTLDLGIVSPHLLNHVTGQVPIAGRVDTVTLETATLDWTATPRIGVGYRFANAGELIFSYQSLVSNGSRLVPNFDAFGSGFLESRLNMNVANLDWVSRENSFGPNWGMKWRAGVAFTNAFFDSRETGQALFQRTANIFNTAGARAGLDLNRALPAPGLSLFGRLDGMFMVGPVDQSVAETIRLPGGSVSGATNNIYIPGVNTFTNTATPIVLTVEGGVSFTPPSQRWLRLTAAYHFERWWAVGMPLSSDAELIIQGILFRAEVNW